MLMKKILCTVLSLLFMITLVSCGSNTEETTANSTSADDSMPVVSLVSDKTTVSAGEEITVNVHIKNAPLTACFDIYVYADASLSYITSQTEASEMMLAANVDETDEMKPVVIRGIVAAAYDILDDDICTITYIVNEDVPAGTKITLSVQVPSYQLALDKSGNDVYSVNDSMPIQGLVLEVQ